MELVWTLFVLFIVSPLKIQVKRFLRNFQNQLLKDKFQFENVISTRKSLHRQLELATQYGLKL